jgi:hypothetical protein
MNVEVEEKTRKERVHTNRRRNRCRRWKTRWKKENTRAAVYV